MGCRARKAAQSYPGTRKPGLQAKAEPIAGQSRTARWKIA
jgi:hypothetical protein